MNAHSRTRRDHQLWEDAVNKLWDGKQPVLSPDESLLAARKLYRHAMGKAWPREWKLVTGRRHTWPRNGVFCVNPDRRGRENRGLRDIIHLMSHWCHRRLHPSDKPHSIRQLRLEAKLTKFAIARKWHEGSLKKDAPEPAPEPTRRDVVVQRYQRMVSRREKWAREAERAARLLDKAEREVRTYELRHRERLELAG